MKLYLVRHGDAQSKDVNTSAALTLKGIEQIEKTGIFLHSAKLKISRIIHSGKLRAQQTAEILAKHLKYKNEIEVWSSLSPEAPLGPVIHEVSHASNNLLLVGHMPFMSKLASQLLTQDENNDMISFQKGSILCFEKVGLHTWILNWMLTPDLFI